MGRTCTQPKEEMKGDKFVSVSLPGLGQTRYGMWSDGQFLPLGAERRVENPSGKTVSAKGNKRNLPRTETKASFTFPPLRDRAPWLGFGPHTKVRTASTWPGYLGCVSVQSA